MLDKNKWLQFCKEWQEYTCVPINDTGNYDMTAKELFNIPREGLYFYAGFNPTTYHPCYILDLYKTKEIF